jgi:hypothetical protein
MAKTRRATYVWGWIMAGQFATAFASGPANSACSLVSAAELEAVLGAKVSGLSGGNVPGEMNVVSANVQMCTGHTPAATILLRTPRSGGSGGTKSGKNSANAAEAGLKMAKEMGAQVELKTFGPITCSTIIPVKEMEAYGFNTTCSVVKGSQVGAIEITVKNRKDMVPIDKLRPVAEKIASRMH